MERYKYRHYTQEQRLAYLKEFDASGKSLRKFCKGIELNEWTLHKWLNARRHQTGVFSQEPAVDQKFISLRLPKAESGISPPPSTAGMESGPIVLHRGPWSVSIPRNVQMHDLQQVVRVLGGVDGI